jgi:glycosyltransferase involved in cell wall biosynthesis
MRGILARAGCLGQVEFAGYVAQEALESLYRASDICVNPSEMYESFSYTCAQAMAAGKPVVASRIGGIPEVVADGECGILVDPGDAAQLAEAITRLACDRALRERMGEAAHDRVRTLYAPDRVGQETLAFYRATIAAA